MGNCCSKTLYLKTLVLGPINSGKTTLMNYLEQDTNGCYYREYFFYNRPVLNNFIESMDETVALNQVYLKQVQGVILVVDLSRIYTNLVDQLNALIDFRDDFNLDYCINIVGTKSDMANQLTMNNIKSIANVYHYPFYIASTQIVMNNSKVFDDITQEIAHRIHINRK